jgi:hypothetical protein
VPNYSNTMSWRCAGEWSYSSNIIDLGTIWRPVVKYTTLSFYPGWKRPRHHVDKGLGGPRCRSGCCEGKKKLVPAGNWNQDVQLLAITAGLSQLVDFQVKTLRLSHLFHACYIPRSSILSSQFLQWRAQIMKDDVENNGQHPCRMKCLTPKYECTTKQLLSEEPHLWTPYMCGNFSGRSAEREVWVLNRLKAPVELKNYFPAKNTTFHVTH